jgi:hypothetical protein
MQNLRIKFKNGSSCYSKIEITEKYAKFFAFVLIDNPSTLNSPNLFQFS